MDTVEIKIERGIIKKVTVNNGLLKNVTLFFFFLRPALYVITPIVMALNLQRFFFATVIGWLVLLGVYLTLKAQQSYTVTKIEYADGLDEKTEVDATLLK
jgi:hypothetical protein